MHILGVYVQDEVSMIKPVARKTRKSTDDDDNDDNIRWTIHDYIVSLAFIPNEPKCVHEDLSSSGTLANEL